MKRTDSHDTMIAAGLNLIQQAMSIFDSELRLVLSNRPMQQMFNLPDKLIETGVSFEAVIRFLAEAGEYGEVDDLEEFIAVRAKLALTFEPHYMERTRANGRVISVEGAPLPEGGWVTVYTDYGYGTVDAVKFKQMMEECQAAHEQAQLPILEYFKE